MAYIRRESGLLVFYDSDYPAGVDLDSLVKGESSAHHARHESGGGDVMDLGGLESTLDGSAITGILYYPEVLNLVVQMNSSNPTYQIDIDADGIKLINRSTKKTKWYASVNVTVDVSTTGANGRNSDTAEQASKWYEIKLIGKADGTIAGFLVNEDDRGSETYPTDYDYSIHLGWVYNDSGSNFDKAHYVGNMVYWDVGVVDVDMAGTAPTSWTDYTLTLPPTVREWFGYVEEGTVDRGMYIRPKDTNWSAQVEPFGGNHADYVRFPCNSSQQIQAYSTNSAHYPTLTIYGWIDDLFLKDD